MLSRRQELLLRYLMEMGDWVRARELAMHLGVSDRTVRSDVNRINGSLQPSLGFEPIRSSRRLGYRLEGALSLERFPVMDQLSPHDRPLWLLKTMVMSRGAMDIGDLEDQMGLSEPTIMADLRRAEEVVRGRGFDLLIRRRGDLLYVDGPEGEKRRFMLWALQDEAWGANGISGLCEATGIAGADELFARVVKLLSPSGDFLDLDLVNIFLCAVLSAVRSAHGMVPDVVPDSLSQVGEGDLELARQVLWQVCDFLRLQVLELDVSYLGCMISLFRRGRRGFSSDRLRTFQDSYYLTLTCGALCRLRDECGFDFSQDDVLVTGLSLHFKMMRRRMMAGHMVRNPLLSEIRRRYPLTFEMAILFLRHLSALSGVQFGDEEVGFVAMHFGGALERMAMEEERNVKLAVICPSGEASAGLIMEKLRALYGGRFRILGPFSFAQRDLVASLSPNCVLSTVPLDIEGLKVITISPFFDHRDREVLEEVLFQFTPVGAGILPGLFRDDLFVPDLNVHSPEEAIRCLCSRLEDAGLVPGGYVDGVLERERLMSTSVGNLLAIPHSVRMEALSSAVAVGMLKRQIPWGEHRVRLVMLFALKKGDRDQARAFYEAVGRLVEDPSKIDRLLGVGNYGEFLRELTG
jgi:lichenan operon transcriptional antiterminator